MKGHLSWVTSVGFSPDGTRIVSGSYDKLAIIWDAKTGAIIGKPLKGHSKGITCVSFSPEGTVIATGSEDKLAMIWDAKLGS